MSDYIEYHGGFMSPERADNLRDELTALRAERDRLREALGNIAKQRLAAEATEEERDYADYEGAYECCVSTARAALQAGENDGD